MSRRILVWITARAVPLCIRDWWELADFIKQENEAGRSVTITKWEYV